MAETKKKDRNHPSFLTSKQKRTLDLFLGHFKADPTHVKREALKKAAVELTDAKAAPAWITRNMSVRIKDERAFYNLTVLSKLPVKDPEEKKPKPVAEKKEKAPKTPAKEKTLPKKKTPVSETKKETEKPAPPKKKKAAAATATEGIPQVSIPKVAGLKIEKVEVSPSKEDEDPKEE